MNLQSHQPLHINLEIRSEMLVQEYIHGHRLNTDQEAYMILLETLAVINDQPLGKHTADQKNNKHEQFEYKLPHKKKMRYLLFKDQNLSKANNNQTFTKEQQWKDWKKKTRHQFTRLNSLEDHFLYLDEKFDDLDELLQAVSLVQSMELDVMNKRRWTSKFLCVTGPNMILPDFRETKGRWSTDRRFFGRGGELVYLMLNRSDQCKNVQNLIETRLLDEHDPYNQIAKSISPVVEDGSSTAEIGYLPCLQHQSYNRLADAWIKILEQDLLSGSHFFDPLFRITGLNLILYLVERACELIGRPNVEPILIDLTDGRNFQLKQATKNNLNLLRDLQNDAVKAFITKKVESDSNWETTIVLDSGKKASELIAKLFYYQFDSSQSLEEVTPEEVLKSFINKAQRRSHNNANSYILSLSKQIGLCTARGSAGTWLAVDDLMIIALVMALVDETVELSEFLNKLYETYNLVIGPSEARKAYTNPPISSNSFEENLASLEERMTKLALTKRLSDDCAFVINPFRS